MSGLSTGTEYGSGDAQTTGGALRPADWNEIVARIVFPEEQVTE
jgi:single-stranded-DNA-specific exonuclease